MKSKPSFSVLRVVLVLLLAPLGAARGAYPGNTCVSAKQHAAAGFCRAVLSAWKGWEQSQDSAKRDLALTNASQKLAASWSMVEERAAKRSVDCADTTASRADTEALLDNAIAAIVTDVNTGLDLVGNKDHAACGAALLGAAAADCAALLNAEAAYIVHLAKGASRRDTQETTARNNFATAFAKATAGDCPTAATATDLGARLDTLVADLVTDTTVSPNVDNTQFTTIAPPSTVQYKLRSFTPICSLNTPYYFFVKRGSVNKLLMYYQGGGACWDYLTCFIGIFDESVDPTGSDNPNNQHSGFTDLSNPDNPFKDWNIVFTPYCTGDIHFGDVRQTYGTGFTVNHLGYQNARVVEKWAREHFVNPDEVFVTGSSAGAYGAFFNAPLLRKVWPSSKFSVLADAGNGVITADFMQNNFPTWDFKKNIPAYIPGVLAAIRTGAGIPAYTQAVAAYFPDVAWAHYSTAYDGGTGGQTGFYNVMLNITNPGEWQNWWHATCQWHDLMLQQATNAAAAITTDNYRYYVGRGSRHTGWGSDTVVYNDDPIGGTPALKTWVTSMRNRDPGWVNVQCGNCETTLPGDPQPSPLEPPFEQVGTDVDVVCP